jgi:methionine aminopeptidase
VAGRWFSPGTPISSTNETNLHDVITAMVGWSYPVNLGMLFTIFTSIHTQKKNYENVIKYSYFISNVQPT